MVGRLRFSSRLDKSSHYAISQIILIAIVVIIIVLASAGAFFLVGGKGSTSTTSASSTSSTSIPSTTSSSTSVSTSASSTSSTSIPSTTSSSTSTSTTNQEYNLPYLKSSNTVKITLTILNNASYAVNFNGTNFGAMEIFVPANSIVNLTLINAQSIPHNLVLVQNTTDVANNADVGKDGTVLLAIATSTTNYLYSGKSTGSYSGNYSNISSGTYWLACGTLGHAAAGLWVDLFASSSVSAPYVVITNPQLRPSGFN